MDQAEGSLFLEGKIEVYTSMQFENCIKQGDQTDTASSKHHLARFQIAESITFATTQRKIISRSIYTSNGENEIRNFFCPQSKSITLLLHVVI